MKRLRVVRKSRHSVSSKTFYNIYLLRQTVCDTSISVSLDLTPFRISLQGRFIFTEIFSYDNL